MGGECCACLLTCQALLSCVLAYGDQARNMRWRWVYMSGGNSCRWMLHSSELSNDQYCRQRHGRLPLHHVLNCQENCVIMSAVYAEATTLQTHLLFRCGANVKIAHGKQWLACFSRAQQRATSFPHQLYLSLLSALSSITCILSFVQHP